VTKAGKTQRYASDEGWNNVTGGFCELFISLSVYRRSGAALILPTAANYSAKNEIGELGVA